VSTSSSSRSQGSWQLLLAGHFAADAAHCVQLMLLLLLLLLLLLA
jgi:hypothetical protein